MAAEREQGRNDMTARHKGFTLVDLAAVLVCIAAIIVLLPGWRPPQELAYDAECQANLKGIGTAIAMYKGEGRTSRFPLLFTTGQPEANIRSTDGAEDLNELKTKLVGREAAMQNAWILIEKGLVTADAFECPSDGDLVPREFNDKADRIANRYGWRSSAEFSYGLHFPYESTTVGEQTIDNPAYLGPELYGSFVMMADKNPSRTNEPATGVGPDKAPSNHRDGQAYLMYSGQVNWKFGAKDSKINDDDIYAIQKENNANPATPANLADTYITRHPTDE
jgi:type II secretory pathway pseudopilin PulG